MTGIELLKEHLVKWTRDEDLMYGLYFIDDDGKEVILKDDFYLILRFIQVHEWLIKNMECIMNLQWSEIEILIAEAQGARLHKKLNWDETIDTLSNND